MKIGEDYTLRRDVVNMFQNHVRDPLMWLIDIRSKLATARDVERRLHDFMRERSPELLIATLRTVLENTEAEVHRRLALWPDGSTAPCTSATARCSRSASTRLPWNSEARRSAHYAHTRHRARDRPSDERAGTQHEVACRQRVHELPCSPTCPATPGSSPRSISSSSPGRCSPRPASTPRRSVDAQRLLPQHDGAYRPDQGAVLKPRVTEVIAPWYAMLPTLQYGGITQHLQLTANISVELNAMGGGAHRDRETGEHAAAPFFATLADWGETEDRESEIPVLCLCAPHPTRQPRLLASIAAEPPSSGPTRSGQPDLRLHGHLHRSAVPRHRRPLRRLRRRLQSADDRKAGGRRGGAGEWFADGAPGLTYDAADMIADRPLAGEYEVGTLSSPLPRSPRARSGSSASGGGGLRRPAGARPGGGHDRPARGLISPEVARRVYCISWDEQRRRSSTPGPLRAHGPLSGQRGWSAGESYKEFVAEWGDARSPPRACPTWLLGLGRPRREQLTCSSRLSFKRWRPASTRWRPRSAFAARPLGLRAARRRRTRASGLGRDPSRPSA